MTAWTDARVRRTIRASAPHPRYSIAPCPIRRTNERPSTEDGRVPRQDLSGDAPPGPVEEPHRMPVRCDVARGYPSGPPKPRSLHAGRSYVPRSRGSRSAIAPDDRRQPVIRRSPRRDRWVAIDNDTIRDQRLSWKARGLLGYLLSMPDNWTARVEDLANRSDKDGREAVRTGLVELEETGYLVRTKTRREDGTYEWFATVHERPECPESDFPTTDEPTMEDPTTENPTVRTTHEELPKDQEIAPTELLPETRPTPAPRERRRDVLFEVVAEVCGIQWRSGLTNRGRQALNAAVSDIRPFWDGTEAQVRRKAAEYRGRMKDAELTPNALAKWWNSLNGDPGTIPGGQGSIMRAVADTLGGTG